MTTRGRHRRRRRPYTRPSTVPGSKSQTNRALILAALATRAGHVDVSGALRSRDTDLMIGALRTLGVVTRRRGNRADGQRCDLAGRGRARSTAAWRAPCCGSSRRSRRSATRSSRSTATSRPGRGPSLPCSTALRGLGVRLDGDAMPFQVRGEGAVAGGTVHIDASSSSQFVSGLLLSGATFADGLTVVHTGESVPSAPHVAMTVSMLRDAGVRGGRRDAQPLGDPAGARRRPALGHRTRPVERGPVPGRRRRHRGHGPHRRLAAGQRATRRHHPRTARQGGIDCAARRFAPRGEGLRRRVPGLRRRPARRRRAGTVGRGARGAGRRRVRCRTSPASPICAGTRPTGWQR